MDSQTPAAGYWAHCVLSVLRRGYHEGATTFTHCRWAEEKGMEGIDQGISLRRKTSLQQKNLSSMKRVRDCFQSKGETNLPSKRASEQAKEWIGERRTWHGHAWSPKVGEYGCARFLEIALVKTFCLSGGGGEPKECPTSINRG